MNFIREIGRWIADNEPLLSGLTALAVLGGLIFTPLGAGLQRLLTRRGPEPSAAPAGPATAAVKTVTPSEPLLAVLAFDNLSSDPEMQFFSDGVSEEIIQRLSRGARLRVIGRTSSFQFRDEHKAEAAQRLNCSHVLDGSIRRAAERMRISAHLGLVEFWTTTDQWPDCTDEVPYDFRAECAKARQVPQDEFTP